MSKDKIAFSLFFGTLLVFVIAMNLPMGSEQRPAAVPAFERREIPEEPPAPTPSAEPPAHTGDTAAETVHDKEASTVPEPGDPFLAEVRRRAREDPEGTLVWLQETANGPERLQGMLEVVAIWAADDSETALLWLESNAQGLARLETLQAGIRLWGGGDPAVAAQWVEGMANDGSKSIAARALAASWAKRAPGEAAAWVATLPDGPIRTEAASALVDTWIRQSPDEAADWALRESARESSAALLDKVITTYTELAPNQAMRFIRNIPDQDTATRAVRSYISAGAIHSPQETADWLSGLSPNDPLYSDSHPRLLMKEWTLSDSVAASAWLEAQRDGRFKDNAVATFAETILPFEPAAAVAWSNSLSDPEDRLAYLRKSVQTWIRADRDAAARWLGEAELEPDLRLQLAEALEEN